MEKKKLPYWIEIYRESLKEVRGWKWVGGKREDIMRDVAGIAFIGILLWRWGGYNFAVNILWSEYWLQILALIILYFFAPLFAFFHILWLIPKREENKQIEIENLKAKSVIPDLKIRELPPELLDDENHEYAGVIVTNHSDYDIDDFCATITSFRRLDLTFDPINADTINPNGDFVSVGAGSENGQIKLTALVGKARFNVAKAVNETIVIQNQKTPYPLKEGDRFAGVITFTGKTPSGNMSPISKLFILGWASDGELWEKYRVSMMFFSLEEATKIIGD